MDRTAGTVLGREQKKNNLKGRKGSKNSFCFPLSGMLWTTHRSLQEITLDTLCVGQKTRTERRGKKKLFLMGRLSFPCGPAHCLGLTNASLFFAGIYGKNSGHCVLGRDKTEQIKRWEMFKEQASPPPAYWILWAFFPRKKSGYCFWTETKTNEQA